MLIYGAIGNPGTDFAKVRKYALLSRGVKMRSLDVPKLTSGTL